MVERQRMVYDGKNQDDSKFAKEMADSLVSFATKNQWSIENMAE
jgi:hypothetical protein